MAALASLQIPVLVVWEMDILEDATNAVKVALSTH